MPLAPGRFRVTLHFAETNFTEAGKRRFGVRLEGRDVLTDFDPASAGALKALVKSFDVPVVDGFLDIDFVHVVDNPMISAFEIAPLE